MAKPKNNPQNSTDRAKLLKRVPVGAHAVYVMDPEGKKSYKDRIDIQADDEILTKDNGDPIVMMNKPGRKRKVELQPKDDTVAEVMEAREGHYADNQLLQATHQDPDSDPVFDAIMMGLASESAALEFARLDAERQGKTKEASEISGRRARVLKAMSDAWLKRRDKSAENSIDFDGKAWETVLLFTMETIKDTMLECELRPEQIETFFTRLGKTMNGDWYEVAKSKLKGR